MRVKLDVTPAKFKPMTLTIEVETQRELLNLWHRFNLSCKDLETVNQTEYIVPLSLGVSDIWSMLENEAVKQDVFRHLKV